MQMSPSARLVRTLCGPLLAVIAALPLVAGAQSATPSLAGPSTARVAQTSTFSGSGFAPNSAVSIAVTAPNATEAHYSAVAGSEGMLSYSLTPSAPGQYTLKVLDTSGRVLVSLNVQAVP